MRSYNHKMNGLDVRRILTAEKRHARRVDGWHAWSKVVELCALAGALLVLVLLLEFMR